MRNSRVRINVLTLAATYPDNIFFLSNHDLTELPPVAAAADF